MQINLQIYEKKEKSHLREVAYYRKNAYGCLFVDRFSVCIVQKSLDFGTIFIRKLLV